MFRFIAVIVLAVAACEAGFAQRTLPAPGAPIPDTTFGYISDDLTLRSLDGTELNFSEFDGSVLFINFWATWCAPCVAEMPSIAKLLERLDGAPVEVLMISIDERADDVRKYLQRRGGSWPVYLRGWRREESAFKGFAIPSTYILSKDRNIVYRHIGFADWDSDLIHSYLVELANE